MSDNKSDNSTSSSKNLAKNDELSPGKVDGGESGTEVSKSGNMEESPLELQQSSEPISQPEVSSIPVKQPIDTDESSASVPEKSSVTNPHVKSNVMTSDGERMDEIIENYNSEGNEAVNKEKTAAAESGNGAPNQDLKTADVSQKEDTQEPQESASNLHVNSEMVGATEDNNDKSEVAKPLTDPERSMASTSVETGNLEEGASKEALSGEPIVMTLGSSAVEVADTDNQNDSEDLPQPSTTKEALQEALEASKELTDDNQKQETQNRESEAPEVSIDDEDESGKSADFVKTPLGVENENDGEKDIAAAKSVEHFDAASKSDAIVATATSLEHESEPVKDENGIEKAGKSAEDTEQMPEDDNGEADIEASKNVVETPSVTREAFEPENAKAEALEASKTVVETPNVTQEASEGDDKNVVEESVKYCDSKGGSGQRDVDDGSGGEKKEGTEDKLADEEEKEEQVESSAVIVPPVHIASHGTLTYNDTEEKQSEVVTSEPSYNSSDFTLRKSVSDVVGTPVGLTDIPEASKEPGTSEEKNSLEKEEEEVKEQQDAENAEAEAEKGNKEEVKRNSNESEEYKYGAGWVGGSVSAEAEAGAAPAEHPEATKVEGDTEKAENEAASATDEDKHDDIDSREHQDVATGGRSKRGSIGSIKRHRSRGARNSITVNPPLQIYSNRAVEDNSEAENAQTGNDTAPKTVENQELSAPEKASDLNETTVNNEVDLADDKNAENEAERAGDVSDSVVKSMQVNVATGKEETLQPESTLEAESPEWGRGDMETDIESLNQKLKTEDVKPPTTSGCCVVL